MGRHLCMSQWANGRYSNTWNTQNYSRTEAQVSKWEDEDISSPTALSGVTQWGAPSLGRRQPEGRWWLSGYQVSVRSRSSWKRKEEEETGKVSVWLKLWWNWKQGELNIKASAEFNDSFKGTMMKEAELKPRNKNTHRESKSWVTFLFFKEKFELFKSN